MFCVKVVIYFYVFSIGIFAWNWNTFIYRITFTIFSSNPSNQKTYFCPRQITASFLLLCFSWIQFYQQQQFTYFYVKLNHNVKVSNNFNIFSSKLNFDTNSSMSRSCQEFLWNFERLLKYLTSKWEWKLFKTVQH